MRIYFSSLTLPKKAAKRVHAHFAPKNGINLGEKMQLSQAQEITAQMLGYASWHELTKVTQKAEHSPSHLDEDVSPTIQEQRITYQTEVLEGVVPLIQPVVRQLALKFRVSSANSASSEIVENAVVTNLIRFFKDPYDGEEEWRFFPSERSAETYEEQFDLQHNWTSGNVNLGDLLKELNETLDEQPENIYAIWLFLVAIDDAGAIERYQKRLLDFEQQIESSIPYEFPRRKRVLMCWGTIENRDFHRAVSQLATCFYKIGKFGKAKKWFNFSNKTSQELREYSKPYLEDLRKGVPQGVVHYSD